MAKDVLIKYLEEKYTEKKMLNMAMGVVIFAREQKELFRSIKELIFYLKNNWRA